MAIEIDETLPAESSDSADSHAEDSRFPLDSLFASPGAAPLEPHPIALRVGVTVGRYELREKIGEGGMGAVFLAHDERLERKVAVKVLRADRGKQGGNARMLREARALARVSHPNVVQVYDSGEQGDNVYIAMEFIDGLTLREWLKLRTRSIEQVCAVFMSAGQGLAAAHEQGLVHRDFKPDNMMIGHDGRVRVMDFGLVRQQDASESQTISVSRDTDVEQALEPQSLTLTGTVLGTPAYMAPEQHRSEAIDARTDQFSFCVAFWEALYGQRPFGGRTVLALAAAVLAGKFTPAPPDAKVPADLHAIIVRGLQANPDARWPAMPALLDALAVRAEPPRRGWIPLALGALGLGAVVMGATLLYVDARATPEGNAAAPLASPAAQPLVLDTPPPERDPSDEPEPEPEPEPDVETETETDAETETETETGTEPPAQSSPPPAEPAKKKSPKKKATQNTVPETVLEADMNANLAAVGHACSTAVPRTIWVEFAVSSSGKVSDARALPPNDNSTLGACVLAALRARRFPASEAGVRRRKAAIKVGR